MEHCSSCVGTSTLRCIPRGTVAGFTARALPADLRKAAKGDLSPYIIINRIVSYRPLSALFGQIQWHRIPFHPVAVAYVRYRLSWSSPLRIPAARNWTFFVSFLVTVARLVIRIHRDYVLQMILYMLASDSLLLSISDLMWQLTWLGDGVWQAAESHKSFSTTQWTREAKRILVTDSSNIVSVF